jgi:hypothetical protein
LEDKEGYGLGTRAIVTELAINVWRAGSGIVITPNDTGVCCLSMISSQAKKYIFP